MDNSRRDFLRKVSMATAGVAIFTGLPSFNAIANTANKPFFKISLAEWSLHRTLQSGAMTNMDFPSKAKKDFGISAVEYVDQYFKDKAKDLKYLGELKTRTRDLDVRNVLIMVDTAGSLATTNDAERRTSIENHYQ